MSKMPLSSVSEAGWDLKAGCPSPVGKMVVEDLAGTREKDVVRTQLTENMAAL